MKKKKGLSTIVIALAFVVGLFSNLAARAFLPKVLPDPWVPMTDLLAFLLQVAV